MMFGKDSLFRVSSVWIIRMSTKSVILPVPTGQGFHRASRLGIPAGAIPIFSHGRWWKDGIITSLLESTGSAGYWGPDFAPGKVKPLVLMAPILSMIASRKCLTLLIGVVPAAEILTGPYRFCFRPDMILTENILSRSMDAEMEIPDLVRMLNGGISDL